MISTLRQAITTASDLALPFPQRQRNLLDGLERSQRELSVTPGQLPIPFPALFESTMRVLPTALAMAGGFAALGFGTGSRTSRRRNLEAEEYLISLQSNDSR